MNTARSSQHRGGPADRSFTRAVRAVLAVVLGGASLTSLVLVSELVAPATAGATNPYTGGSVPWSPSLTCGTWSEIDGVVSFQSLTLAGAGGGAGDSGFTGGTGGGATTTSTAFSVSGQNLYVDEGCAGNTTSGTGAGAATGGYGGANSGAAGGSSGSHGGGGGGGASALCYGTTLPTSAQTCAGAGDTIVAVAGGGGGGGGSKGGTGGVGGNGGNAGSNGGTNGGLGTGCTVAAQSGGSGGAGGTCPTSNTGAAGSAPDGGAGKSVTGSSSAGGGGGGGGNAGGGGGGGVTANANGGGGGGGGSSSTPTPSSVTLASGAAAATAGSIAITVNLGAVAAHSNFSTQPPSSAANAASFSTTVTEKDFNNAAVNDPVQLAISSQPSGPTATLSCGTNPVTPGSGGVASFTGCSIVGPIGNYTLKATDNSDALVVATSSTINLTVGALNSFTVSPSTSTPTAGSAITLTLTGLDSGGNTDTNYTGNQCIDFSGPANSPSGHTPTYPAQSSCSSSSSSQVSFSSGVASSVSVTLYDATHNPVTLTAADHPTGKSGTTALTVGSATANKLVFTSAPSSQTASASAGTSAFVVQVQDSFGNPVVNTGSAATVTPGSNSTGTTFFTTTSGGSSSSGTVSIANGASSSNSFYYADNKAGTWSISASATVNSQAVSSSPNASVTIAASTANKLVFTSAPSSQTASASAGTSAFVVQVQDSFGNPVTNTGSAATVTPGTNSTGTTFFTTTSGGSSSSGTVSIANGASSSNTFYYADNKAAVATISATATVNSVSISSSPNASVTISPAAAATFSLSTPSPTAGTAFNETLTAHDSFGNPATGYSGTKTITFSGPANSPNSTAPSYPATVSFTSGAGTASITLYDAASGVTLGATDGTVSGTSASFTVAPATAATFSLSTPSPTAGTAFNETLTALDAYGNTATGYSGTKTITFSGPANAPNGTAPSYPATVSFTSGAGTASITLYDAASGVTLGATDGTVSGTSASFTVSPATPDHVTFTTEPPTTGTAGSALTSFAVSVQDAYDNVETGTNTGHNDTINLTVATGPGTIASGASANASGGVATFSSTVIDVAGSYTFTATDGSRSITTDTSTPATVIGPATAATLSLSTPSPTAGTAFNETLTALDAYGDPATGYSGTKTITFSGPANAPNGTAPSYPATVSFTSGAGTASITLYDAASGVTLGATDGTVSGTSASFTVSPATPDHVTFTTEPPTTGTAGSALTSFAVSVQDAYDNVETGTNTGHNDTINLTVATGPGTIASGASANASGGVATFSSTVIDVAGSYTFTATDGSRSITTDTSTPATVIGPATAATFSLSTPSPTAGTAFNETLTALDAYGNTATGYSGTKTITFSGPANAPNGTAPSYPATVSFTSGAGTASITLYDAASGVTLGATDGTVSGTSASFTVSPATPDHVTFTTEPPTTGTAGSALTSFAVSVQDAYDNVETGTNTGHNDTINLTVATGPGTIASGASANASGGVATFSSTVIDVAGSYTFTATDGSETLGTDTSTPATVIGLQSTTTTLTTSANPAAYGATVTLTATVSSNYSGTALGSPTGSVAFTDSLSNPLTCMTGSTLLTSSGPTSSQATCVWLPPASGGVGGAFFVTAQYSGDVGYAASSPAADLEQDVLGNGATTFFDSLSANPSPYGAAVTITASVSDPSNVTTPTGTVTFFNQATGLTLCSGPVTVTPGAGTTATAQCTFTPTGTGGVGVRNTLRAIYSGDVNFAHTTASVTLTEAGSGTVTSLTAAVNPTVATVGVPITLSANVTGTLGTGGPTGNVTFLVDGSPVSSCAGVLVRQNNGSNASCQYTPVSVGSHTVTASYNGDIYYAAAGPSSGVSVTVNGNSPSATSTPTLLSPTPPVSSGSPITVQTTVSGSGPTPTGSVSFSATIGSSTTTPCPSAGLDLLGNATCTFTPAFSSGDGGTVSISAAYSGDTNYATSASSPPLSLTVQPTNTVTSLSLSVLNNPLKLGSQETLTAKITGSPLPTGSVTFTDNGSNVPCGNGGTVAVTTSGTENCSYVPTYGSHTLQVTYSGSNVYLPVTSTTSGYANSASLTVTGAGNSTSVITSSANPSTYGTNVTFTDTITGAGGSPPSGTVTFTASSGTICSPAGLTPTTGSTSIATCTWSPALTGTGATVTVNASWPGDMNYAPKSAAAFTQTELGTASPTTFTLTPSANPIASGSAITITAKLTGPPTPTGTVSFTDNGNPVTCAAGSAVKLNTSGIAQCLYNISGSGTHTIVATYSGNTTYAVATKSLIETVT